MALELTPLQPNQLPEAVARVAGPQAPAPAKIMAAKGLAPLGPTDLVTALYQLTYDADPKVAEAARQGTHNVPPKILAAAMGQQLDGRVIDYFVMLALDRSDLVETVLLNTHTADETFVTLAGKLGERELEILAGNQQRLLRHPPIIEALYFNKFTRMSTANRAVELAIRNGVELPGIPQFKELAAAIMGTKEADKPETPQPEHPQDEMDELFTSLMSEEWEQESEVGTLEYEGDAAESERNKNISQLPVSHKIRLALLGSAGDRNVLIRDSNKIVAMSAIKSPKITDQEVVKLAGNRAVCEDVIRYIADRREWQKHYQVKLALVSNPKCPLAHAMRLLPHLRPNDLKLLARSKNVPSALTQVAKRLVKR